MSKKKLQDWIICGRLIGKASGWDQADTWIMQLYDFEPHKDYIGPIGDAVSFDFEAGLIESYNKDGTTKMSSDLIETISNLPRGRPPTQPTNED